MQRERESRARGTTTTTTQWCRLLIQARHPFRQIQRIQVRARQRASSPVCRVAGLIPAHWSRRRLALELSRRPALQWPAPPTARRAEAPMAATRQECRRSRLPTLGCRAFCREPRGRPCRRAQAEVRGPRLLVSQSSTAPSRRCARRSLIRRCRRWRRCGLRRVRRRPKTRVWRAPGHLCLRRSLGRQPLPGRECRRARPGRSLVASF